MAPCHHATDTLVSGFVISVPCCFSQKTAHIYGWLLAFPWQRQKLGLKQHTCSWFRKDRRQHRTKAGAG